MNKLYHTKAKKFYNLYIMYLERFTYQSSVYFINKSVCDLMTEEEKSTFDNFRKTHWYAIKNDAYNFKFGNDHKYEVIFDKSVEFIKHIYSKYLQKDGFIKGGGSPMSYKAFEEKLDEYVIEEKEIPEFSEEFYNIGNKYNIGDVQLTKIAPELNEEGYYKNHIYGHCIEVHLTEHFSYEFLEDNYSIENGFYITNDGYRVDIHDNFKYTFYAEDEEYHPLLNHFSRVIA